MALTPEKIRLVQTIDEHVNNILSSGGGDEQLLVSLADHMGTFKQIMDTSSSAEMTQLCQQYDGFYRFAKLLEKIAGGIANGTIAP